VLDDKPPDQIGTATECANSDGFAFKIFDGFELWPALQHEMWRWPVARNDSKRQALKNRAKGRAKTAKVVSVAVAESNVRHRS
jgi:hypothetical protein